MKNIYLLLFLLTFLNPTTAFAQKQDFVWPLCKKVNDAIPGVTGLGLVNFHNWEFGTSHIDRTPDFYVTHGSICNEAGDLLFYTNGIRVWNQEHEQMENGFGLNPGSVANGHDGVGYPLEQGAMVLPLPESDTIFYIFHKPLVFPSDTFPATHISNFFYSLVNLSENNGLGKVIEKNISILEDTLAGGQVNAVRHANGRDWWLLCKEYKVQRYHTYLLSPDGITFHGNQSFPVLGVDTASTAGRAIFSQDGSQFIMFRNMGIYRYIDFFDFDRCNGKLSKPRQFIPTFGETGNSGVALSPSGRFLYYSVNRGLWQIDTWEENLEDGIVLIDTLLAPYDPPNFPPVYFGSFLAPDGKIYCSINYNYGFFHVIHQPDKKGLACQLERDGAALPCHNDETIPNFPNFRLGPIDGSPCDSLGIDNLPMAAFNYADTGLQVHFRNLAAFEPEEWFWTFGDGSTSAEINPVHTYADTGTYEVCQTVSNTFGSDTWCREVQVQDWTTGVAAVPSQEWRIYPNPASTTLFVESAEAITVEEVRMVSPMGQQVGQARIEVGASSIELDVSQLPPGLYFLAFYLEAGGVVTRTFIKQ